MRIGYRQSMTRIEAQGTPSDRGRRTGAAARPKSVLFCPICGHESAIDDDWLVTEVDAPVGSDDAERAATDGGRREFVCPDCEAVVTVR